MTESIPAITYGGPVTGQHGRAEGPEGQSLLALAEGAANRWAESGAGQRWGLGNDGAASEREQVAYAQGYLEASVFWSDERHRLLRVARLALEIAWHPYSKKFRARRHFLAAAIQKQTLRWGGLGRG